MTILNASNATEAVNISLFSDQFNFVQRDATGTNSATAYSWLTGGGDDVQTRGLGMDFTGNPPNFGNVTAIDIDLSNNNFANPDVRITAITAANGGGGISPARLGIITDGAQAFFNEVTAFNDTVIGSAFNDTLKAGGGADTISAGGGNDLAYGDAGNDVLSGENGDDSLYGGAGLDSLYGGGNNDSLYGGSENDQLFGGSGNDRLDGGTGADAMNGEGGNDTYIVDNTGDTAIDTGGGIDSVFASVTHTLSSNIEYLYLTGTGSIDGRGNTLANIIVGNSGSNDLFGFGGNDTISGGDGADILDGGVGADVMMGGAGNDLYYVDNAGDTVTEGANQGTDRVQSSVSFTLGANVENLTLTGTAANGTGNGLSNVIIGNNAANVLFGAGGSDDLYGGGGVDVINGGSGADFIRGGAAGDVLVGGTGADVFDFDFVQDSASGAGPGAASRDVINGFDGAGAAFGDLIDLSTIDANQTGGAGGNQAFVFLGVIQNPFPPATAAGSIWLRNEGTETVVHANVDGDAAPELSIRIADGAVLASAYSAADFIL